MKIAGTGPVRTKPVGRRTESRGTSEGGFAGHLSSARSSSGAAAASQTSAVEGLLALQEVDEDGRGRRQAKEHGEALLDRLDEIREALLTGRLNSGTLDRLLTQIRRQRATFSDPRLAEILDEIELRAAVELAKLGRAA